MPNNIVSSSPSFNSHHQALIILFSMHMILQTRYAHDPHKQNHSPFESLRIWLVHGRAEAPKECLTGIDKPSSTYVDTRFAQCLTSPGKAFAAKALRWTQPMEMAFVAMSASTSRDTMALKATVEPILMRDMTILKKLVTKIELPGT